MSLQELITSAYRDASPNLRRALELRLAKLRPQFKQLLVEEPKSEAKRKEIQQGTIQINGVVERANAEFVKGVVTLSDLLDINETKAASLLKHAISCRAVYNRDAISVAVIEYTRERLSLVDCLELMVKGAFGQDIPEENQKVFRYHLSEVFVSQSVVASSQSYGRTVLNSLSALKEQMTALHDEGAKPLGSQLKQTGVSEETIRLHLENLVKLRSAVSALYLSMAIYRRLDFADITYLMETQKTIDVADPTWPAIALSLLASLQAFSASHLTGEGEITAKVLDTLKNLSAAVWEKPSKWNIVPFQQVVGLQIGILVKKVRNYRASIEEELGLRESIESTVEANLQTSSFAFIQEHLMFQKPIGFEFNSELDTLDEDMRNQAMTILRSLMEDTLKGLSRMIRNLKNKAEDAELPHAARSSLYADKASVVISPFEQMLKLTCELYGVGNESGLVFWTDPALLKFLKFMLDIKSSRLLCVFLDVLASISTGLRCAQYASEFLSTEHARLSWIALFRSLDLTAKSLISQPEGEMHPDEVQLQCSFLKLLKQVIAYSDVARISIYSSPNLQAVNTIFSLLNRRISVELKAALFEVIAAFTLPSDKSNSAEISIQVWRLLEQAEVLPKATASEFGAMGSRKPAGRNDGVRFDMDQIESQNQTYPETNGFLTLLNTLLLASKPSSHLESTDLLYAMDASQSVKRYIDFAVDDVFLKVHNRIFASTDEKWKMIDLCLRIMDTCLKSFDIAFVSGTSNETPAEGDQMMTDVQMSGQPDISRHYGFPLISRILSGQLLIRRIFEVIGNGVEFLNRYGTKCAYFGSSVRLSLRIILRVLTLQKFILDSLVSTQLNTKVAASITGLDQILAFYKDIVIQIALYVNCSIDDEICLLAVNIMTLLTSSTVFNSIDKTAMHNGKINRLVSLLSSSEMSSQIILGFVYRLDLEEPENDLQSQLQVGYKNFVSALGLDNVRPVDFGYINSRELARNPEVPGIANIIRLAILDLLISNVGTSRPFPTISHYLLGYNIRKFIADKNVEVVDLSSTQKNIYCLHVILNIIRAETGEQRYADESAANDVAINVPLHESHPKLSELCYQLLYYICADQSTSFTTMRYLRTAEDFFYRQLEVMPIDAYTISNGAVLYETTDSAKLHQRAWLLKMIALELHITTIIGQRSYAQRLLDLLYLFSDVDSGRIARGTGSQSRFDQPLTKMLEILNSLDFEGRIEGKLINADFSGFLNGLDMQRFILTDGYGHSMYDIRSIHLALVDRQRMIEKQGGFSSPADRSRIQLEISTILGELLERNKTVEHLGARVHVIYSWCEVMRTTLAQSFELLPVDSREDKIFEMLAAILPKMNSSGAAINIIEHVSYVVLALLSRLRDDRRYQDMIQSASNSAEYLPSLRLPADSLQQILLKGILESIVRPESTSVLRGNQYAALLHYLHYTNPDDAEQLERSIPGAHEKSGQDSGFDGRKAGSYRTGLLAGNLAIINSYGDKFFEILCRDASDGAGVWKTVAFSLLEALSALSSHEKPSRILTFLVRRNFLNDFIRYINMREDEALVLLFNTDKDHDALKSFFIFEAKLSMFLRIAQSRDGSEKLLDSGIVEAFAECRFIDEKPERDTFTEDSFLLHASELYNQAIVPVLQLVLCILSHSNRDNTSAIARVSQFVYRHKDVFISIIKSKSPLASQASMEQIELCVAILTHLGTNRQLLEIDLPGPGFRSFHNLLISTLNIYQNLLDNAVNSVQSNEATEKHIKHVLRSLLSYCELATDGEIDKPDLSLVFSVPKDTEEQATSDLDLSRVQPTQLLKLFQNIVGRLLFVMDFHKNIRLKLTDIKRLSVDEINELASKSKEPFFDDLSTSQRQLLAVRELKKLLKEKHDEMLSLLYIMEHCLILLWRVFRAHDDFAESTNYLRQAYQDMLGVIQKINSLEFTADMIANSDARNAFIQMLFRKKDLWKMHLLDTTFDDEPPTSSSGHLQDSLLPIFSLDRVQFSFPGSLTSLAVSNNWLAVALRTNQSPKDHGNYILLIDLGQTQSIEGKSKIEVQPRTKGDRIRLIFMDPLAQHIIISTEAGDNYYLHRNWKKPKYLTKFKGIVIEAIAFGQQNTNPLSTGVMLIASKQGHIYESEIQATEDYFKREDRYFRQVYSLLNNSKPVIGIHYEKVSPSSNKYVVIVATADRLYNMVGDASEYGESMFTSLFQRYSVSSNYQEIPHGQSVKGRLCFWKPLDGDSSSSKPAERLTWLTDAGVFCADLAYRKSANVDTVFENTRLIPYHDGDNEDEYPLTIAQSQFHVILLFKDRVKALGLLNDEKVYEERIPLEHGERVVSIEVDAVKNTFWVHTSTTLYELIISEEDRNVWKLYLDKQDYATALEFAKTSEQRNKVIVLQAEHQFSKGDYVESAALFASSTLPFEEVVQRFLDKNETTALRQYLLRRLEKLKRNELTQSSLLCLWICELFIDAVCKKAVPINGSMNVAAIVEEPDNDEEVEFKRFLKTYKDRIDIPSTYSLIISHGRLKELLYLAELTHDHERIILFWIENKEYQRALLALAKQSNVELYYRYASLLMEHIPDATVDVWMKQPDLNPRELLPALVKYEQSRTSSRSKSQSIRYLEFVIDRLHSRDASIHNYLLSLYVEQAQSEDENQLLRFLSSHIEHPIFDLQQALRMCTQHQFTQSCVYIYAAMGLFEQAVEMALKHNDIELARINADKPVDDSVLRKKLWLRIAHHVVKEKKDIREAISILKMTDLLKIEDILPLFPDFVHIDDFKEELFNALESYNQHIEDLKSEMDDATRSSESIRNDIRNLRKRFQVVSLSEKCSLCKTHLVTRQFYVFPCKHVFHGDCLIQEMITSSKFSKARRLVDIQKKLASSGENVSTARIENLKAELDALLSNECILCGETMIKQITKPFVNDNELEAWTI
ncbi:hypothetical protein HDV05_001626 [Chytridiales sp. JEL 0842]|nr:hypothetical protein HDV05_001626 [Chytridiales sp. JEL 0842]